jgi:hypothetical protein
MQNLLCDICPDEIGMMKPTEARRANDIAHVRWAFYYFLSTATQHLSLPPFQGDLQ